MWRKIMKDEKSDLGVTTTETIEPMIPKKIIKVEPSIIKREDLEKIDPEYLKTLTDEQLFSLHDRLHKIYHEYCRGKENDQK